MLGIGAILSTSGKSVFPPKLAGRPSVMNGAAKGEPIARGKDRLNVQERLGAETL
jgi:hypothetical protein